MSNTTAKRPSLASMIRDAERRRLAGGQPQEAPAIYITPNGDRTWSAGMTAAVNSAKLVQEQDYPVELLFNRRDLNGSSVLTPEPCNNREYLLDALNWIGRCGFTLLKLWDFDPNNIQDEKLKQILATSEEYRRELDREAAAEFAAACMEDFEGADIPEPDNSHNHKPLLSDERINNR